MRQSIGATTTELRRLRHEIVDKRTMERERAFFFAAEMLAQTYRGGDILELMPLLSERLAERVLKTVDGVDRYILAAAYLSTRAVRAVIEHTPVMQVVQYTPSKFAATFLPLMESKAFHIGASVWGLDILSTYHHHV